MPNPSQVLNQLNASSWVKLFFVVLGAVLAPVAAGAWFLSSQSAAIATNSKDIRSLGVALERFTDQVDSLVRYDERLKFTEKQLSFIYDKCSVIDDMKKDIEIIKYRIGN